MTHDGPMARIVIRDHGMGVHPQETHRIFERFYRSGPHRRSSVRGSGLGLSIAKRIVDAHHGRIWAENLPDGGFQVSVEVPLADDHRGRSSFPLSGRAEGDGDG